MLSFLYRFFFFRLGWKVSGDWPADERKFIIVVAPHTSNWDFMIGLCVRSITKLKAGFLGKKELFRFPFGGLFRRLGGYPVERSKSTNFVETVANMFREKEDFIVAIAPEGTRKFNDDWKTGFFYIAKSAEIPIVPTAIDYSTKTVHIGDPVFVTGDVQESIQDLKVWFSGFKGKYPELGVKRPLDL